MSGCISIYDSEAAAWYRYDETRCAQRYVPCSSFKIAHALIALECGVITNCDNILEFDPPADRRMPGRNAARLYEPQDMHSAIRDSVVWYFQKLARSIGQVRECRYLLEFDYGNSDVSSGLENFWLGGYGDDTACGSLAISADEQVMFLRRMCEGELCVSDENVQAVMDCLVLENSDSGYVLSGKTGLGELAERDAAGKPRRIGWLVGYVQRPGKGKVYFAMNIEADQWEPLMDSRQRIVQECMASLGFWDDFCAGIQLR